MGTGIYCQTQPHLSYMKKKKTTTTTNISPTPDARSFKHSVRYVREIPMHILTVGKKRSEGVQLIVEEYMKKLKHYCSIQDTIVKSNPKNTSNVKAQIEAEDISVMQLLRPDDWVVVLDEHGADIGSEQMANLVEDAGKTASSRLLFCIGGPYGHGPQVQERANVTIRLSSMVLNHQIALIVLLEQLYRFERYANDSSTFYTEHGQFLKGRNIITDHTTIIQPSASCMVKDPTLLTIQSLPFRYRALEGTETSKA